MQFAPQHDREASAAESAPNAVLVREQLKRLLGHPLFTNSKRYPVLLAYVVEQALMGNASELKERTIGIEAFGREPSYDVNLDPVVRMTAAEVRRRLSQYYYNPEHAGELVVELPVGSYVPSFREPAVPLTAVAAETSSAEKSETSTQSEARQVASQAIVPVRPAHSARRWGLIVVALVLAAIAGYTVGRGNFLKRPSDMERFWKPITSSSSRVTYCLGEPVTDHQVATPDSGRLYGSLNVSDVLTLSRSIVPLVPRSGALRVIGASDTEFTQLREGPVVLIGAYDNAWTMRISEDLPFGLESDGDRRRIVDRKSGGKRSWQIRWPVPHSEVTTDYAIVARIQDKVTGQPVIILAGILGEGTEAAGEVVSNPVYLDAMLQKAPKDWDRKNLAAVIETHVIDGHPGPPSVVAVETW